MHGRENMPYAAYRDASESRRRCWAQVTQRTMQPAGSNGARKAASAGTASTISLSARPGVEGGIGGHVMPRYFFNISDDDYSELDREGMELPNQKAAESQAIALAQTFASRD